MLHCIVPRSRRLYFLSLASALLLLSGTPLAAVEEPGTTISTYLAAGEFGPALKSARTIQDVQLRDRWLGRIALAQADVGAQDASLSTLSDVKSDVARSQVVRAMNERPFGAGGGAAYADFDTLIELITSSIAPDTWDAVGGAGGIEPFPMGVYVDSLGVMKRLAPARHAPLLEGVRKASREDSGNRKVDRSVALRKVSLVRLERQIQLDAAFGRSPDEAMRMLAGMYRVRYLFVFPDAGDIVLAGPAGPWHTDGEGRVVNIDTGTPVLQLDDLVILLRNAFAEAGRLGCAIKPRQENLMAAKSFADAWRGKPVRRQRRSRWIEELRACLGKQDIEVWGIDAGTRAARILVEADYHMKLVGMGLEDGTLGVDSYLEMLKRAAPGATSAMNVLRWWFTLNYEGVRTSSNRDAFQWDGPGVRVLSETELLTERGERIHTGKSEPLTAEFAHSFTRHFDMLAAKYPVYADLRNIFDLALVCAIVRAEDLPGQVNWHMTHFGDTNAYRVTSLPAPREVESIVNAMDVSDSRFIVGVSGGVAVDTSSLVDAPSIKVDDYGLMEAARASAAPVAAPQPRATWWWD